MFTKATVEGTHVRLALMGLSGSGKTFTALRVARGLGGKVALIDSEFRRAQKYSDRFDFDVCNLDDKSIRGYGLAIDEAAKNGYEVLIIDSLTHAWEKLRHEIDMLSQIQKYKGNSWAAWSQGTPKQRAFIDHITEYPGHVIATMRSKTEWSTEGGKYQRVGLSPIQGKQIEYDFDIFGYITPQHCLEIITDHSGKFQDSIIDKPGEEFGRELAEWLALKPEPKPKPKFTEGRQQIKKKKRTIN